MWRRVLSILSVLLLWGCLGNGGGESQSAVSGDLTADERVARVALLTSQGSQVADGQSMIELVLIAYDKANVPLVGIEVSLTSSSDTALLAQVRGKTDENGRFATTVTDRVVESVELTPTAGTVRGTPVKVSFTSPVTTVGEVIVSAESVTLPVNGSTRVSVTTVQSSVSLSEVMGNNNSIVLVDWALLDRLNELARERSAIAPNAPLQVSVSGTASLQNVPSQTDAQGQATFVLSDSQAETVALTVTSGNVTRTFQLYFGASLTLLPPSVNATQKVSLQAVLKDGNNSPLEGKSVDFGFDSSNHETLSAAHVTTQANGMAEVVVTDVGNDGGTAVVVAQAGQLSAQATVRFLTSLGQGYTLEASSSATVLAVGQSATLTAIIKDSVGIPASGQTINLSVEGNAQLSQASAITDGQGKIQVQVSDTVGENVMVTLQAGTASQKIPLYFGATVNLTPREVNGTADDRSEVKLTASLLDAQGSGIPGAKVYFRTPSQSALLGTYQVMTDSIGRAEVTVRNSTVENTVVEVRADGLPTAQATIRFSFIGSGIPRSIILTTTPPSPVVLSLNGTATITAQVLDGKNIPVTDGTRVDFTTNIGRVTPSAFTRNGKAEAVFSAGTTAGLAQVTASSGIILTITAGVSITVKPGEVAGMIEVYQIDPSSIGIVGSGVVQASNIQFLVKDSLGNRVPDGTVVNFSLGKTTLGGGETITTGDSVGSTTASTKTNNGIASVVLKSGTVAGNIDIIATSGQVSTVARVIIVSGSPDADHLSLAMAFLNIAGGVTFGLQDTITAYVGDRFGNVVPDKTSVSFITEGGVIGSSVGTGGFTTTTQYGQATAILQSASPTTPLLGGVPTLRKEGYECSGNYSSIVTETPQMLCGNPGLVTVVAYTTGSESFLDVNGNGVFDSGDRFSDPGFIDSNQNGRWDKEEIITNKGDMSEPFIDGNDNGVFEGELYIDVNQNGYFDGPDGVFQANTTIWQAGRVLFSDRTGALIISPSSFKIKNGSSQTFTLDIADQLGNALTKGTRFTVTTNNGVLGGTTDILLDDSNGRGMAGITFTLASNPPWTGTDENGNTRLEYPPETSATVIVTIKSDINDKAPGGNGGVQAVVSGVINSP